MRRILLLAVVGSLVLAGAAYAATVTPIYILNARVAPMKSGTRAHGVPIASHLGWTVKTSPPNRRPPVVESYRIYLQGIRQNIKYFPVCSTSTLNSSGPGACAKGSQIGAGSFIAAIGPSNTDRVSLTCRVEMRLFNGGADNLILYVYTTMAAGQCALPPPHEFTITVGLFRAHGGRDLVEQFSVPMVLRHPASGVDAAVVSASINVAKRSKKVRVGRRMKLVGLFETDYCPPNHQRTVKVTFNPEQGRSKTATKHVACS
jgi:hypothetical protein